METDLSSPHLSRHRSPTTDFTPKQIEDLTKNSGIDPGIASSIFGLCNISEVKEVSKILGWTCPAEMAPALGIPCYPAGDQSREPTYSLRPDTLYIGKDGKPRKYLQPDGSGLLIYFPPTDYGLKPGAIKVITEGAKKAIKLRCAGYDAVAGLGVWAFHDPALSDSEAKTWVIKPELASWAKSGETVYICFDARKQGKPNVLEAEVVLAGMLDKHGVNVRLVQLPLLAKDREKDTGVDEYLTQQGSEAFAKVLDQAWEYPLRGFLTSIPKREGDDKEARATSFAAYLSFEEQVAQEQLIGDAYKLLGLKKSTLESMAKEYTRRRQAQAFANNELPLKTKLEDIRFDLKKHPIVKAQKLRPEKLITDIVLDDMKEKGRFLIDNGHIWYFDAEGCVVNSIETAPGLDRVLIERYDIHPGMGEYNSLLHYIRASKDLFPTKVHKVSYFDRDAFKLFLYDRPGEAYLIRKDGWRRVKNGEGGVYFADLGTEFSFDYTRSYEKGALGTFLSGLKFDVNGLGHAEVCTLLDGYIKFTLFHDELIPLLHPKGPQGSGKTVTATMIGKLLVGANFRPSMTFIKTDGMQAALCNKFLLVIDNLQDLSDDEKALLCCAVSRCPQITYPPKLRIWLAKGSSEWTSRTRRASHEQAEASSVLGPSMSL